MKYIFLALLLCSCSTSPDKFEATITNAWYSYSYTKLLAFSGKYGTIEIFNSPYFETVKMGQKVVIGCAYTKGFFAPLNCAILGAAK